jgi:DNA invertase Pin-like site-specific DNA recombinase
MKRSNVQSLSNVKRVYGYVRVSTAEQADTGASLEGQKRTIQAECDRNGWELVAIIEDAGISAKNLNRPGLKQALEGLNSGTANVLMASKLDRLSRSTADVCNLGDMAKHYGWDLCLLDARIDTTTPHGRAQLSMMAAFAQLERELAGLRTREGLAVKRSQGVKLGRPRTVNSGIEGMLHQFRSEGLTLREIADRLNADSIPTGQGGSKWFASSVSSVLNREKVAA